MKPVNVLLVNSWIYDFAAYDLWSKPLGLLKIASRFLKVGIGVSLIDCLDRFNPRLCEFLGDRLPGSRVHGDGHYHCETVDKPELFKEIPRRFKRYGIPPELFLKMLEAERPDVIFVTSGMTYWYPGVFEAIRILKKRFPSIPVVLGGIYARLCPEHAKRFSGADLVYHGNDIKEITGIVKTLTGKSFDTATAEAEDLTPGYDLYPRLRYITLRTSSGCPFRCTYCAWYLLEDGFRQADPGTVLQQIEYFAGKGIDNFAFYDEALLFRAEDHVTVILEGIVERRIRLNLHTPNGLHIRFITPGLARLFKRAGVVQPRLGLETASAARQEETGGKVDNREFLKAVNCLKEAGYNPGDIAVNILMGLPGQGFREIRDSIEYAASTGARIFLEAYSPIPGTPGFAESGLPEDCDPLLHNNSAFPLYRPEDHCKFERLKELTRRYNHK
ncbi:MAG: B12-binding domain-containing radical SAM protein [Bacillota bacterium]